MDYCSLYAVYIPQPQELAESPKFQNTDGEDFTPAKIYFDLKCTPEFAVELLGELNQEESKEEILAQADLNEDGQIDKVEFPWLVKGNKINKSWSNTIFAHLTISDSKLLIEVNSSERANKAKDKIQELLGQHAVYKSMLFESLESKLEEVQSEGKQKTPEIDINEYPEVREKLKEMHDKHWSDWLDMTIPALDNQTPREAAKTEQGRERLEALFSQFHQGNLKLRNTPNSNQHEIDLHALREKLDML